MRLPMIAAAALLAYTAWRWSQKQDEGGAIVDSVDQVATNIYETTSEVMNSIAGYSYSKVPAKYQDAISQAEGAYGLPDKMLARLLWQECRYNEKIIDGRKTSPVGALGIAQFMPATAQEMGIDPLDPYQAIDAAGSYLRSLYRQTGNWAKALAAYNWGIGNIKRKGLAAAPQETRNYFTQILSDIGMA